MVVIYIRIEQHPLSPSNTSGYNIPIQRYPFSPLTSSYRSHVLQTSDRAMQRTSHPLSVILHLARSVRCSTSHIQAFFVAATASAMVSPIALELKYSQYTCSRSSRVMYSDTMPLGPWPKRGPDAG